MTSPSDIILVLVILINLLLLGTGRLRSCIRAVAVQGAAIGLLPLLVSSAGFSPRLTLVAVVSVALKGFVFPWLLFRSMRSANVRHEVDPVIGYTASILAGVVLTGASFWMASRLQLPIVPVSDLVLPVALSTILCGLLLIVSRRQALSQVVGYLVLENGIYIFGTALAHEEPLLVEMGILLDVFVAVLVMGVAVFHISREFDHIDVDHLARLKD
ncbi:MAG: NADH-quinone oxidoreductase subunit K [Pirellulales bacterium]